MAKKAIRTRGAGRGPKPPSIYDVARAARVSVFTVSAVINNSGRVSATLGRRVEAAIRKLSYRPNLLARSLAKQQTHTLGMVVTDIANPFFPAIVRAAEDAAQKAGYSMLLCNSDDKEDKEGLYLELLLSKRIDGIILNKTPGQLSAFRYRAGLALLPRRPDAVLVTNYLMTVGFKSAADEIGLRCPEDFALVSFDDYPWLGCFRPRLTTIELPKYELGSTAVRLLLERIQGKRSRAITVNLPPQLRVRESCGFMLHSRKESQTVMVRSGVL